MHPLLLLALVALPTLAAEPAPSGHDATIRHRFDDPKHWAAIFDDPARDAWQKPDDVIGFLAVKPGAVVADLGAGTGYFTVRLARAVGPEGKVLAVEIEPNLVDHLKKRALEAGLKQVVPVLAEPSDPKLPPAGVDLVLVCDTWHHIDDRVHYLGRLAAALRPGGRVAIVDFKEGELPVGPPPAHKLSRAAIVDELKEGGFSLASEKSDLPYQYVLVFTPNAKPAAR